MTSNTYRTPIYIGLLLFSLIALQTIVALGDHSNSVLGTTDVRGCWLMPAGSYCSTSARCSFFFDAYFNPNGFIDCQQNACCVRKGLLKLPLPTTVPTAIPTLIPTPTVHTAYPDGCCYNDQLGNYRQCPSGQVCDIPNGSCGSGGKSCNDQGGGFHKACVSGQCVNVAGSGPDTCTSNTQCLLPTPTLAPTYQVESLLLRNPCGLDSFRTADYRCRTGASGSIGNPSSLCRAYWGWWNDAYRICNATPGTPTPTPWRP